MSDPAGTGTGTPVLELLSSPAPDVMSTTQLGRFLSWLASERQIELAGWEELRQWSVRELSAFWAAVWDFHGVQSPTGRGAQVLARREMPGAQWFPDARLNYAGHALGSPASPANGDQKDDDERVAVIAHSQTRAEIRLTAGELRAQVARAQAVLKRLGVGPGDRVAAYLPNIPETVVAFLAAAGLGAIWASCAPEFGPRAVIDRFAQIEPTVLLAVGGYRYGEKLVDRRDDVARIRAGLPSVRHLLGVTYGEFGLPGASDWAQLLADAEVDSAAGVHPSGEVGEPEFLPVPFDHPLCVLFSSGTTGTPKAIVHCHGGILLEHLKNHSFSWDLHSDDVLLWFSTTAWMMWNALVSGLLVRAAIVLIDGNPLYPDPQLQWRLAEQTGATLMGASPGYLMSCRTAGMRPARDFDLASLRQIGAAGSPLPAEGYHWVHEQFGARVLLNVGSGGTDVCSGLVQGSPLQPVWAGEMSGACLGVDAKAFDPAGRPVVGQLGELVITAPMPSMPVGFWGDADGSRYRAAYFATYPGVWRHGDWIRFSPAGSCIITGRSDATLNRGGVRLGTAEFYRVVEELAEVEDSLVVHLEDQAGGNGELVLFVVLRAPLLLDAALIGRLRSALRTALSPRHVPDTISQVPAVPRNRTGKRLELPVKRILLGAAPAEVLGPDTLADPASIDPFVQDAAARALSAASTR